MRLQQVIIAFGGGLNEYLGLEELPALVFGNGPTQSTTTRSKGSPMTGIGCNGAGGTGWLGFPELTHMTTPTVLCDITFQTGPKEMVQD